MDAADDPQIPTGWSSYPVNDADEPPGRAWNDASWSPPHDNDPDPLTTVKLMPEYGVEQPLWGADWWRLSVTPQLLDALADWQEQFDINFRPETGWVDDDVATEWGARAEELAATLSKQLQQDLTFEVDLWPVRKRSLRLRLERQLRRWIS